jgi:hypothetical protein
MVNTTILFVALALSAPPTSVPPTPKAKPIAPRVAYGGGATYQRTAQAPVVPELPPAPPPGISNESTPKSLSPNPHLDPFDAPRLSAENESAAPLPPPLPHSSGYHPPVTAQPLNEAVPAPLTPIYGDAGAVDTGYGANCPNCYGCPSKDDDDDDGCCVCGPDCPCDLYPHYAYYPKYHGHYYFRPYNYTTVFQQQQWAAAAGLDPRNPYSNKVFDCVFAGYEQRFRIETAPVGSALPVGNNLPQLEDLLNK